MNRIGRIELKAYERIGILALAFLMFCATGIASRAAAPPGDSACTKHVLSTMDELSTLVKQGAGSDRIGRFLKGYLDNYHCDWLDLTKIIRRPEITLAGYQSHTIYINGELQRSGFYLFQLDVVTSRFVDSSFHYEGPI